METSKEEVSIRMACVRHARVIPPQATHAILMETSSCEVSMRNHFAVSVPAHAGVCAAAVLATLRPPLVSRVAGPPIVLSWPLPSERRSHSGGSDQLPGPTASPIDVPQQPPI